MSALFGFVYSQTAIYTMNSTIFCSSKFEFNFLNSNLMVPANPVLMCR
jgi:hypothetical protein